MAQAGDLNSFGEFFASWSEEPVRGTDRCVLLEWCYTFYSSVSSEMELLTGLLFTSFPLCGSCFGLVVDLEFEDSW